MTDTSKPIRLLQFAPNISSAATAGAEIRNEQLARQLARTMTVARLGFRRVEPGQAVVPGPTSGADGIEITTVPRRASYHILDLLWGAIGPLPFSVLNYTTPAMKSELTRRLSRDPVDIVLIEGVSLGDYVPLIRSLPRPPRAVVCEWHNIESEILRRYGEDTRQPLRKLYAAHAATRLSRYERAFVRSCDLHVTVSERDRAALLCYDPGARVCVVENGVDTGYFHDPHRNDMPGGLGPGRNRLLFVGSMDYHANVDAAVRFAANCWPLLHRRLPGAVFTILGRNPAAPVRALAGSAGIEVTGTVSDLRPYYREAFAVVVPLRVGGGTRLKILEAMAAGVPVVSTSRGVEGLAAEPGLHFELADSDGDMVECVAALAGNPALSARLAGAARSLVERRYDWSSLGQLLAQTLMTLISRPPAGPDPDRSRTSAR